jgi:hypothetical protein
MIDEEMNNEEDEETQENDEMYFVEEDRFGKKVDMEWW